MNSTSAATFPKKDFIYVPSYCHGFEQDDFRSHEVDGRTRYVLVGKTECEGPAVCPCCGAPLIRHGFSSVTLAHLPYGGIPQRMEITKPRFICGACGKTFTAKLPFKAKGHNVTCALETHVRSLLEMGLTLKAVARQTGLCKNTVRAIDQERLEEEFTFVDEQGVRRLKPPKEYSRFIGIDEFKLHDGNKYATIIMDLETGRTLYLGESKENAVVSSFIKLVGEDWMKHVVAIGCDMNAHFEQAFTSACPWIKVVYDHFHIIKNFNDKVIAEIRKDIQRQLISEGRYEEAERFKRSKYLLVSSRKTLEEKDAKAEKALSEKAATPGDKKPSVFHTQERNPPVIGRLDWYDELKANNNLIYAADYIKETLATAYTLKSGAEMKKHILSVIDVCQETGNRHMLWFARLLKNHFDGIVSHAEFGISSGKVEGTNNKIKTLRRQCYGLPDNEYFFLKIMDWTSHKRSDPARQQKLSKNT